MSGIAHVHIGTDFPQLRVCIRVQLPDQALCVPNRSEMPLLL